MKKSEHLTTPTLNRCRKDNKSFRIKATIRALFLQGQKLYASDVNRLANTNDACKYISVLRGQDMLIDQSKL